MSFNSQVSLAGFAGWDDDNVQAARSGSKIDDAAEDVVEQESTTAALVVDDRAEESNDAVNEEVLTEEGETSKVCLDETEPEAVIEEGDPEVVIEEGEPEVVIEEGEPEVEIEECQPEVVIEEDEPEVEIEECEPEVEIEECEPEVGIEECQPEIVIEEGEPEVGIEEEPSKGNPGASEELLPEEDGSKAFMDDMEAEVGSDGGEGSKEVLDETEPEVGSDAAETSKDALDETEPEVGVEVEVESGLVQAGEVRGEDSSGCGRSMSSEQSASAVDSYEQGSQGTNSAQVVDTESLHRLLSVSSDGGAVRQAGVGTFSEDGGRQGSGNKWGIFDIRSGSIGSLIVCGTAMPCGGAPESECDGILIPANPIEIDESSEPLGDQEVGEVCVAQDPVDAAQNSVQSIPYVGGDEDGEEDADMNQLVDHEVFDKRMDSMYEGNDDDLPKEKMWGSWGFDACKNGPCGGTEIKGHAAEIEEEFIVSGSRQLDEVETIEPSQEMIIRMESQNLDNNGETDVESNEMIAPQPAGSFLWCGARIATHDADIVDPAEPPVHPDDNMVDPDEKMMGQDDAMVDDVVESSEMIVNDAVVDATSNEPVEVSDEEVDQTMMTGQEVKVEPIIEDEADPDVDAMMQFDEQVPTKGASWFGCYDTPAEQGDGGPDGDYTNVRLKCTRDPTVEIDPYGKRIFKNGIEIPLQEDIEPQETLNTGEEKFIGSTILPHPHLSQFSFVQDIAWKDLSYKVHLPKNDCQRLIPLTDLLPVSPFFTIGDLSPQMYHPIQS